MRRLAILVALALAGSAAAEPPPDPLGSPMWVNQAQWLFGAAPVRFDPGVVLTMPQVTENQHMFPVTVDARTLGPVSRIVVLMDLNPIPVAIDYTPGRALGYVSLRIRLDQKSPVRAAVQTPDGVWHLAGRWVDAAGGGCSAPPLSRVRGDWADHLGELRGAAWRTDAGIRLRASVRHPMDTGFVGNIAPYNIERLEVRDGSGAAVATMAINGSVAEDPAFTLMLPPTLAGPFKLHLADSNGRLFDGVIALGEAP